MVQGCWTSVWPRAGLQAQSAYPCVKTLVGLLLLLLLVPLGLPEDSCSLKLYCWVLTYFLCIPPTSGAPGPASPGGRRAGAEGEGGGSAKEGASRADGEGPP